MSKKILTRVLVITVVLVIGMFLTHNIVQGNFTTWISNLHS
ncbi:MAG: hypothetical protein OCD02_15560 [Spirochaetaceae bacterium]